jgi:hypothetical protein
MCNLSTSYSVIELELSGLKIEMEGFEGVRIVDGDSLVVKLETKQELVDWVNERSC